MKLLLIVLAFMSLILGICGIFLPVLPTTPFLLLSAWLFSRSSHRLHIWLLNHGIFGRYIRDFQEEKALALRVKVISVSFLWIAMLFSMLWVGNQRIWLQTLLLVIAIGVTWHILSFKTKH